MKTGSKILIGSGILTACGLISFFVYKKIKGVKKENIRNTEVGDIAQSIYANIGFMPNPDFFSSEQLISEYTTNKDAIISLAYRIKKYSDVIEAYSLLYNRRLDNDLPKALGSKLQQFLDIVYKDDRQSNRENEFSGESIVTKCPTYLFTKFEQLEYSKVDLTRVERIYVDKSIKIKNAKIVKTHDVRIITDKQTLNKENKRFHEILVEKGLINKKKAIFYISASDVDIAKGILNNMPEIEIPDKYFK